MSNKSVPESVKQECLTRVSVKCVNKEYFAKVPNKKCQVIRVSYKSIKQECLTRMSNKNV